jgi:organic radical activating enzyme
MNTQIPTKHHKSSGGNLNVHSIFHTIQGEGPFSGKPAVFIRLAGCNLQCPGCDTEYTDGIGIRPLHELFAEISKASNGGQTNLVVITGGEPFRQNLKIIVDQLHMNGVTVQIETNGTMAPQEDFDINPIVICSPKTTKIHPKMEPLIEAYKYVINYRSVHSKDGLPIIALGNKATPRVARPHNGFMGEVFVSPMDMSHEYSEEDKAAGFFSEYDAHNKLNLAACAASAMKFNYRVQVQLHKLLGME